MHDLAFDSGYGSLPVGLAPFWHPQEGNITVICFHGLGCSTCGAETSKRIQRMCNEGFLTGRGQASFRFDNEHHSVYIESTGFPTRCVQLDASQFPQVITMYSDELASGQPIVSIWPAHFLQLVERIPFQMTSEPATPNGNDFLHIGSAQNFELAESLESISELRCLPRPSGFQLAQTVDESQWK